MEEQPQLTYKQLSTPLKVLVWYGWIALTINALYFIAGFIGGFYGL